MKTRKIYFMFYILIVLVCTSIKVLLIPTYRSTDFEVHRNWLAITHSLPMHEWYFEATSPWTLDYPPFFAYFEYILSQIAVFVDPNIVNVNNLNYQSPQTIYFQRFSVIATDFLYLYAIYKYLSSYSSDAPPVVALEAHKIVVFALLALNSSLLLIDHIHFQYNGILLGLLILCFYTARTRKYDHLVVIFSVLLLMKHLFIYLAFVFGLFLIHHLCIYDQEYEIPRKSRQSMVNFIRLAFIALVMLGLAFGPIFLSTIFFSYRSIWDVTQQFLSRLFPFSRGLVHAYWAPNIWALYCLIDKVITLILTKLPQLQSFVSLKSQEITASTLSSTGGVVGEFKFNVLYSISASVCMLLILVVSIPGFFVLFRKYSTSNRMPNPFILSTKKLIQSATFVTMTSFMLGYHVHEKAIIIPMICQGLLLIHTNDEDEYIDDDNEEMEGRDVYELINHRSSTVMIYLMLSLVGTYSLFPLLIGVQERFCKGFIWLAYNSFAFTFIGHFLTDFDSRIYNTCWGILVILFIFAEITHPAVYMIDDGFVREVAGPNHLEALQHIRKFEFLPLLLTSVICAFMLIYVWYKSLIQALSDNVYTIDTRRDSPRSSPSPLASLLKRSFSDDIIDKVKSIYSSPSVSSLHSVTSETKSLGLTRNTLSSV